MGATDELEPFRCVCRNVILRANEIGLEQFCDNCQRREVVPYEHIRNKEALFRYMIDWRNRQRGE